MFGSIHYLIRFTYNTIQWIHNSERHQRARWKRQIFPIRADIDQYIPLHLLHVSSQCRQIAAKQSVHIALATRTFWSLLCGCTVQVRIIAHTKAHALSAHTQWYPGFTQNHTVMQYTGSRDVDLFPPCNAEMGLSKLVTGGAIIVNPLYYIGIVDKEYISKYNISVLTSANTYIILIGKQCIILQYSSMQISVS